MSEELHFLSLAECAQRIKARSLSPVELTKTLLTRIAALNPLLNAFITITGELATEQARAAELEITRIGPRSPLHGVPFGLKDIYDTRGITTTGHSALLRKRVPQRDSHCAERLLAAGGVLMGKLATHEFATGGPAYDLPWPPAQNPWLAGRFPGGSSSGSAAAVAAGLLPGAMGSDTGGSIRLPAAFCGLVGLKPTYGRVSKRGVLPLSWTLDTCGPLTRTVQDCALMLQAIAGPDPQDPSTAAVPVPDFCAQMEAGIAGMRVGVARHLYERDIRASDETIAAMDESIALFQSLGARIVDLELAPLADFQACNRVITISEAYAIHRRDLLDTPHLYSEVTRYRILPGALIDAATYCDALRFQRALTRQTMSAIQDVDVLITASTYGPAPVQASMRAEANFSSPPLTNPFNTVPLPAVSLCNGFSPDGLPLSMQIVGRVFEEPTVLRAARAYERETDWHNRHPSTIESTHEQPPPHPGANPAEIDPKVLDRYRSRALAAGLRLDEQQLADLCQAMPHLEKMIERIPTLRDYDTAPSTVYHW